MSPDHQLLDDDIRCPQCGCVDVCDCPETTMDNTNTLRTAAQAVVDAHMNSAGNYCGLWQAINDLRAALAQPEPAIGAEASGYPKPYAGDWSVFNGAGACICEGVNFQIAADYMTENRFARGWTMVACKAIKSAQDLASASASEAQSHAAWPTDATDRVHALMGEVATQAQEIERLRYQLAQPEPAPTPPVALPAVVDAEAVAERLKYIRERGQAYLAWQAADFPGDDPYDTYPDELYQAAVRPETLLPLLEAITHPVPASASEPYPDHNVKRPTPESVVLSMKRSERESLSPEAFMALQHSAEKMAQVAKDDAEYKRSQAAGRERLANSVLSSPASGASTEVQAPIPHGIASPSGAEGGER